jgi:hypothetical protein
LLSTGNSSASCSEEVISGDIGGVVGLSLAWTSSFFLFLLVTLGGSGGAALLAVVVEAEEVEAEEVVSSVQKISSYENN